MAGEATAGANIAMIRFVDIILIVSIAVAIYLIYITSRKSETGENYGTYYNPNAPVPY